MNIKSIVCSLMVYSFIIPVAVTPFNLNCSNRNTRYNKNSTINSTDDDSNYYIVLKPVSFDIDAPEFSIPNFIQEYQTTSCFPIFKGFYRTKKNIKERFYNVRKARRYLQRRRRRLFNIRSYIHKENYCNAPVSYERSYDNINIHKITDLHEGNGSESCKENEPVDLPMENQNGYSKHDMMMNVHKPQDLDGGNGGDTEYTLNNKCENHYQQQGKIISEYPPVQKQLFWKEASDKNSIRKSQAKLMKQYMDMSADPCEDFYQYACGNWARLNPIPKDKTTFDTFEMLRESLDLVLRELLEEDITENDIEAYVKSKNLYKSCISHDILEQRGDRPLIDLLRALGDWPILKPSWDPSKFDWIELMANLRLFNNDVLISEWVGPDIKNSDEYVIQFDETSLGLPSRDYYLQPTNRIYLEAYKTYMIKIATLLGSPPENAESQADEIVAFETALAKITLASNERRNVSGLYQRMTVGELKAYVPQVDWQRYLTIVLNRSCSITEPVVIFALRYVQDLVVLLSKTPSRTIANYLLWRFVRHRVNNLDDRYQAAKQEFYYILAGREKAPPRWKYCVTQVNSNMGMAVGAMYVRKYFQETSRNDTLTMTKEIQQSFNEILQLTNWIGDETKMLATDKVNTMILKVGYPDFILVPKILNDRYKDVKINPEKYFENTLNILRHLTRVEQGHLGTPVNKSVWNTPPAVVNAYYSRNKNQIMFPAGILQPPFYHRHFPKSLNYGGIGVVIGHEITHGFDDKGRIFDKYGNLHRWWKDEEINNFHERAQCLIEQYSKYVVQEVGIPLDGINTQGENIADNGGIKQAYRAYKKWLVGHGISTGNYYDDDTLPGLNLSGQQLFFLNFAQVWCGNTRPEASRNGLKTAVHSPGKYRVIGTLSNSEDFSRVFSCPPGSPMNPLKKCSVW